MSAYAPLSQKIFGNQALQVETKLSLANSLVFSSLFFNTHCWAAIDKPCIKILECMQMRVLRRIANQVRTGEQKVMTDLEVRQSLSMPSVECLIQRKRLIFVSRLQRYGPVSLLALLQARPGNLKPKWVELIISNFKVLKEQLPAKLAELPDPALTTEPWIK